MLCTTLVALAFVAPPRLDADGTPLPAEAVQRLGSARFLVNNLRSAAFSPDGKTVYTVSGSDATDWRQPDTSPGLIAWEVPSGKKLWQVGIDHHLERVAADPDGKSVWALERVVGKEEEHLGRIQRVRYAAADGKELARTPPVDCYVMPALHPTGVMADHDRVTDRDGESTDLPARNPAKEGYVTELVWSPTADCLFIYSGDAFRQKDHCLTALDVSKKEQRWSVVVENLIGWCVHPDGQSLVVVTQERKAKTASARRLDAKTGKEVAAVEVPSMVSDYHDGSVESGVLHVHPDGKTLYVIDRADHPTAIDVATWKTAATKAPVFRDTVFSADGKMTLTPSGRHVALHDTATGKRLSPSEPGGSLPDHLTRLQFAATSDRVTRSGGSREPTQEWDVASGKETRRVERKDAPTPPGEYRAAVSADGQKKAVLEHEGEGWRVTVTSVNRPNDPAAVLNAGWGKLGVPYRWMSFTPDAGHLVAADPNFGLHVWDVKAGGKPAEVKFGRDSTYESMPSDGMQVSPSGRMVAVVEGGGPVAQFVPPSDEWPWRVGVYEVPSGKLVDHFEGKGELAAYRWVDDRLAALVNFPVVGTPFGKPITPRDGKSKLVNIDPTTKAMRANSIDVDVRAWAAAPFGDMVAVGSSDGLRLYEAGTGKLRYTFREQTRPVQVLAFSPDGRYLAAESVDGPLLVWDVRGDLTKPAKPDAAGWEAAWTALGGVGAESAFRAVRLFAVFSDDGAAELKARFAAQKPPAAEAVTALVARLGDRDFKTRQQAENELRAMGTAALPALKRALDGEPSEELKARAEKLLAAPVFPDVLRAERAVEALRLADTDEARKVLAEWAKGEANSPLTAAARRK